MRYKHLSLEERYQIYAYIQAGFSQQYIAKELNRNTSTISREINRNKGQRGYRPKQAHHKSCSRKANNALKISQTIWSWVISKLKQKWRPEQISGVHTQISHTSIYRYLRLDKAQGGQLYRYLRHQFKSYKYGKLNDGRGSIPNRVSIHQRAQVVDERARIGDWELDTIIGQNHQQAVVTIVERSTGLLKIKKVTHKSSNLVKHAIIDLLKPIQLYVKTLTADNGKEFSEHVEIKQQLKAQFYFADAYSSWQRGSNENTNGLIREYLPKGTDFTQITDHDLQNIEDALNNRPRKRLDYRSPNQVFFNIS